jgi:hypothetical protein
MQYIVLNILCHDNKVLCNQIIIKKLKNKRILGYNLDLMKFL